MPRNNYRRRTSIRSYVLKGRKGLVPQYILKPRLTTKRRINVPFSNNFRQKYFAQTGSGRRRRRRVVRRRHRRRGRGPLARPGFRRALGPYTRPVYTGFGRRRRRYHKRGGRRGAHAKSRLAARALRYYVSKIATKRSLRGPLGFAFKKGKIVGYSRRHRRHRRGRGFFGRIKHGLSKAYHIVKRGYKFARRVRKFHRRLTRKHRRHRHRRHKRIGGMYHGMRRRHRRRHRRRGGRRRGRGKVWDKIKEGFSNAGKFIKDNKLVSRTLHGVADALPVGYNSAGHLVGDIADKLGYGRRRGGGRRRKHKRRRRRGGFAHRGVVSERISYGKGRHRHHRPHFSGTGVKSLSKVFEHIPNSAYFVSPRRPVGGRRYPRGMHKLHHYGLTGRRHMRHRMTRGKKGGGTPWATVEADNILGPHVRF